MPKSKSNKVVHLTQVKKKGKGHKEDLVKQLEQYGNKFERVYLFDFEQTKSDRIMLLRARLKEYGRIFSGKNSLVSLALRNLGSKSRTNYDELIKQVSGHRGLLFTDLAADKLIDLLTDALPEFRAKLLGCADLKRPAVSRSDDEDAGSCSDEENATDEDEKNGDDDAESNDVPVNEVELSADTTSRKRGMARQASPRDKKTTKQKKGQMRMEMKSTRKQVQKTKGPKSAVKGTKPKAMDKKQKSRTAKLGETVAPSSCDVSVVVESAEVSRKKLTQRRHKVRFENLR